VSLLRVAVATCAALPDLDEDGALLRAALTDAGLQADVQVWDDEGVDWAAYGLVLVRSTWDYALRREEFLAWAHACRATANPADVLAWNTDKRYLAELEAAGVPTVPTVLVAPGEQVHLPDAWRGGDLVVKPTVSAGAADTGRFAPDATAPLVERIHRSGRTAMVQPYLPGVEAAGETSLVVLGGTLSHVMRKQALLTSTGEPAGDHGTPYVVAPSTADDAQLALLDTVLAAVPGGRDRLSYARVDLLPGPDGSPVLLELELTEPSLFLQWAAPEALARLADDVAARVAG
jgi:hypothetical protein